MAELNDTIFGTLLRAALNHCFGWARNLDGAAQRWRMKLGEGPNQRRGRISPRGVYPSRGGPS